MIINTTHTWMWPEKRCDSNNQSLTDQGLCNWVSTVPLCLWPPWKKHSHRQGTLLLCHQAYTTCQVFTNKELTKFLAHLSGILGEKNRQRCLEHVQHMTRHKLYKGASTDVRVIINFSLLTLSHVRPSLSTNILISSGMAREGWVSLSWMATYQVQHTHITFLDSIPTILDKSPQDSHALFIISGFAHNVHFENVYFVWALS